jgi:uncharacterized membrane protein
MSASRIEAFADGVFAIAATLLILNVDNGVPGTSHDLAHELLHAWPSYVAYATSFLTIGIIWSNHHLLLSQIAKMDRTFQMLNVGLLLCVAFIPFPTRLVAEHIHGEGLRAAALAYGITMTAMAVMFLSLWLYASHDLRLLKEDADARAVTGITRAYLPGTPTYLAATLVAFVSPLASIVLFAALALFYALESTVFGRRDA